MSTVVTRDVEGWRRDEHALYRGDTRSPEEIRAAGGFHPHKPGSPDLRQHVHGDTNAFVSTSTDRKIGVERAGRGAVYVIKAPGGIHTDPTMRANGDHRGYGESEVLFPGGVDWRYVAGWHEVRYDPGEGKLTPGPFVPNPDYIGDRPATRPDSTPDSRPADITHSQHTQPQPVQPQRGEPQHVQPQHVQPPAYPQTSFGPAGSEAWEAQQRRAAEVPPTAEVPQPVRTYEPVERPQRPLGDRLRDLPDERLDKLRPQIRATPAGMSVFGPEDARQQYTANQVPRVPGQFVIDMHGAENSVRAGRSNLSPDDVADIMAANPDWDGRTPILLVGCSTGKLPDGFAARLAERTGVEVTAPNTDAWVDGKGNVFASQGHPTLEGPRPGWPPNGEWHSHSPDGTHRIDESPYPEGREPTWGDDTPDEAPRDAAQRGDDDPHHDSPNHDSRDHDGPNRDDGDAERADRDDEVRTELEVTEPNRISGRSILRDVRESYVDSYREVIEAQHKRVAVIRFDADPDDPDGWKAKMDASRVSAEQKVKNIGALGYEVDHVLLPPSTDVRDFRALLDRYNGDDGVSGIIVQMPVEAAYLREVPRIAEGKDVDALLEGRSPQPACATADGIAKVVEPFLAGGPRVAVVGHGGFVGGGVVRVLERHGADLLLIEAGDDLRRVRDADVVVSVTGAPGILGPEHLRPDHLLVVDSGFVPRADGSVASDVRPEASGIPRHITPVPGGIGPVEMAVLLERLVRADANPGLPPWRVTRREGS